MWKSTKDENPIKEGWYIVTVRELSFKDDENDYIYPEEIYVTIALYKDCSWIWSGGREMYWDGLAEIKGNQTERLEIVSWKERPKPFIKIQK